MTLLEMGDSSLPVVPPAPLPVYGFYIGGTTPHVWTDAEIRALTSRYGLPIYVRTAPDADAASDAQQIVSWLHAHNWTRGTAVAIDTEETLMPGYLAALLGHVSAAGFLLLHYESKGHEPGNEIDGLDVWVADWTGTPHLALGSVATQYADASMIGRPWDASVIAANLPLHELHPQAVHSITYVTAGMRVPVLGPGDSGPAVRRAQVLLEQWSSQALDPSGADGLYGPVTTEAVRTFQRVHGITPATGTTTAGTWERLVEG